MKTLHFKNVIGNFCIAQTFNSTNKKTKKTQPTLHLLWSDKCSTSNFILKVFLKISVKSKQKHAHRIKINASCVCIYVKGVIAKNWNIKKKQFFGFFDNDNYVSIQFC